VLCHRWPGMGLPVRRARAQQRVLLQIWGRHTQICLSAWGEQKQGGRCTIAKLSWTVTAVGARGGLHVFARRWAMGADSEQRRGAGRDKLCV
jgi:hypothetical protein